MENLPLERAYYWEKTRGRTVFLSQPVAGKLRNFSWRESLGEARRVGAWLEAQHWPAGSRIVILSRNCAWWILAEFAIWMAGHVTVPIYTSIPVEAARRLFEHSEPVACFIGALDNAGLVPGAIPEQVKCIRFPVAPACRAVDWEAIVRQTAPLEGEPRPTGDTAATIIYTSGTTGAPKGVVHKFEAFPYFAEAVTSVVGKNTRQRALSYLPLAHIAERALTETAAIYEGWRLFFCESTATFLHDLRRARPTIFFSVPRLYGKFQEGVLAKISQSKLDALLRIPVIGWLVRRRILRGLGLSHVKLAASGSAPLPYDLLLWYRKLGLHLLEGYGTTETGITHTAPRGQFRPGFVGRSAPGVTTKIDANGEVLIQSPMNMLGYYRDPEGTRAVFTEDGFIRTGDLGVLDEEGWLKITGRLKEQFKTSKGEYVSPASIEMMLAAHSAIESCVVMGAGLAAPFAVAVLSAADLQADRQGLELSLLELLAETNAKLAHHEQLKFLVLTNDRWSIENGFLTPTLKLKRPVVEAYYAPYITEWAGQDRKLIWKLTTI